MKIKPIINSSMSGWAKNKNLINKSMLVAPLLLAISTPEVQAKDVFNKTVITSNIDKNTDTEDCYKYNTTVNHTQNHKISEKAIKKIAKLEAKENKYLAKLKEKENNHSLYSTILKAINGDEDSKKQILKHIQENSTKRDIAIFAGTGIAGVALALVTGPAALLISISSFLTTNQINNYIVDKKTNPKQKEEVVKEIKKLEDEINDIKNDIKTIRFKISELK